MNLYFSFGLLFLVGTFVSGAPSKSSCSCGAHNVDQRVVNGQDADRNEYPWQVSIRLKSNRGHFCGGSVIASRWVLSAAHCFQKDMSSPSAIFTVTGAQYIYTNYGIPSVQEIDVEEIINHASYDDDSKDNDIALLKLKTDITFNDNCGPVCLPYGANGDGFDGSTATIMGWGTTSYGGTGSVSLLEAQIPILSTDSCRQIGQMDNMLTDNMICTYEVGKDTCQGDSGGPLTIERDGKFVEVGVVSFGKGCGFENWPGVYAKVKNYLPWIEEKTGETFCQ